MLSQLEELPLALEPAYGNLGVNEPITLYEGALELEQCGKSIPGSGSVRFEWLPRPRVQFTMRRDDLNDQYSVQLDSASLHMQGHPQPIEVFVTSIRPSFQPEVQESTISGLIVPVGIGVGGQLTSVAFHVANFSDFLGSPVRNTKRAFWAGRAVTESEGWRITLDSLLKVPKEEAKSIGGFVITHVGRLERIDGSTFKDEESREVMESLFRYLSFCRGAWVAPILAVGHDAAGVRIWQEWRDWKTERWRQTATWFNEFSNEGFVKGYPGFLRLWKNEAWREPLLLSLHWYTEANMSAGGIEGAIVLAQAAFELLAWTRLVEEKRVLSADGFQKLPAMDSLRLLISDCGIPLAIPPSSSGLLAVSKAENWVDGPQALTEMRNALVHSNPKKRRKVLNAAPGVLLDAWTLSLWYLELIHLKLFDYTGSYSNRLRSNCYKGEEVEKLPWT